MMPMSSMPAATIASMPYASTGLLATGMSCLAEVWVKGRIRVPLPPDRIRPFIVSLCDNRVPSAQCPVPTAQCPVPSAQCPVPSGGQVWALGTGHWALMSANRPDVFQRHRQAKRILRLRQRIINQVAAVLERDAVARGIRADEISLIDERNPARLVG